MNTPAFIGKLFLNSICSIFYFGFKYIWKLFKNMRSKPLVISQIKAVIMIAIPVFIILRYPLHIVICVYCVSAMCYGLYTAYQDEAEYEKAYFDKMSLQRTTELVEAIRANYAEKTAAQQKEGEKATQQEQVTVQQPMGFCPFK